LAHDSAKNCRTLAGLLGERGSSLYYGFLVIGPLALVMTYVVIAHAFDSARSAPLVSLAVLVVLPMGLKLARIDRESDRQVFLMLDGKTAGMGIMFGSVLTLAFFAARLLERFN
jgi:1,4-dihydroxy-2-naphthoate octaprenyltransferase